MCSHELRNGMSLYRVHTLTCVLLPLDGSDVWYDARTCDVRHHVEFGIKKKYVFVRTAVQCVASFELQTPHNKTRPVFVCDGWHYSSTRYIFAQEAQGTRNMGWFLSFIFASWSEGLTPRASISCLPLFHQLIVLHSYVVPVLIYTTAETKIIADGELTAKTADRTAVNN